jgi:VanZ family protein
VNWHVVNQSGIGYRFSLLRLLTLAFLYCGAIELMQIPLPTRHARVSDFAVDFAAAALAMGLVRVIERLYAARQENAYSASATPRREL